MRFDFRDGRDVGRNPILAWLRGLTNAILFPIIKHRVFLTTMEERWCEAMNKAQSDDFERDRE